MKLIKNVDGIEIYEGTTFGKTTYTLKKCMCTIGTYYTKEDAFYHAVQFSSSPSYLKENGIKILYEIKK